MGFSSLFSIAVVFAGTLAFGVDVVTDFSSDLKLGPSSVGACQTYPARRPIRLFSVYLPRLGMLIDDRKESRSQFFQDDPLITTFTQEVGFMHLGKPEEFKSYGVMARLYGWEPLTSIEGEFRMEEIIPVRVCDSVSHGGMLGYVLESDLRNSSHQTPGEHSGAGMPPSTQIIPNYTVNEIRPSEARKNP